MQTQFAKQNFLVESLHAELAKKAVEQELLLTTVESTGRQAQGSKWAELSERISSETNLRQDFAKLESLLKSQTQKLGRAQSDLQKESQAHQEARDHAEKLTQAQAALTQELREGRGPEKCWTSGSGRLDRVRADRHTGDLPEQIDRRLLRASWCRSRSATSAARCARSGRGRSRGRCTTTTARTTRCRWRRGENIIIGRCRPARPHRSTASVASWRHAGRGGVSSSCRGAVRRRSLTSPRAGEAPTPGRAARATGRRHRRSGGAVHVVSTVSS